jgi:hypothetical protein
MANDPEFQIFLSHDTRDYPLAFRLFNILRGINASPYLYEAYPQYRQDIHLAIRDVIRTCRLCLCLLTGNGIESQWVHQELDVAFAFDRVIVPCIETGINYKGFVQFRPRIDYDPTNFQLFASHIIYAVRQEWLGHGPIRVTLTCPKGHEAGHYQVPSTDQLNKTIERGESLIYSCGSCRSEIDVSLWTLEQIQGGEGVP